MDKVDAALRWDDQRAYLFSGSKYFRFNLKTGRMDPNYPKDIAGNWPGLSFTSGIDAAVMWNNGHAYFFQGSKYVKYRVSPEGQVPNYPKDIAGNWDGLAFTSGIDAAVEWNNGHVYFFQGGLYSKYRLNPEGQVLTYPRFIAGNWPGFTFTGGVDAGLFANDERAFFFKGPDYVRYSVRCDRQDEGFPKRIANLSLGRGLSVWATHGDAPGKACFDARLTGVDPCMQFPQGTPRGQAGWDMGIGFDSLASLADHLTRHPLGTPAHLCGNFFQDCAPIAPGQITRLVINAHGTPGEFAVNGKDNPNTLNVTSLLNPAVRADWDAVLQATAPDATIFLMGCLAAQGLVGTALLTALSLASPGRTLVGFITVGNTDGARQIRPGQFCAEPGMRDTEFERPAATPQIEAQRYPLTLWNDLNALPWASDVSPHAKVMRDGVMLRAPAFDF